MRLDTAERDILEGIDAQSKELVERAIDWSHISSGSRNLGGLKAQADALAHPLSRLPGQLVERNLAPTVEIDAQGRQTHLEHPAALLVTVRPQAPVQVILTGHYDTVFPEQTTFLRVTERGDGALNGPGLADMKGGISLMLGALQAFEGYGMADRVGYRLLLSPDEEIGSLASGPILSEIGRLGHVGMTYEPALEEGALASGRKGSGNFHIRIQGRAAHAGRDFKSGRNALAAAAAMAADLHELNGRWDDVTINIGKIDGGGPLNMVPDVAILRFNIRFSSAETSTLVQFEIDQIVAKHSRDGLSIERHGGVTRPAKPFNAVQQNLFESVRTVGALIGESITWKPSGGVCEGNNLFAAGLPGIDTLGVCGGAIHSDQEFAWPESFARRAKLSAAILMKLASGEIDGPALRTAMSGLSIGA
jgi:glutamate carboxypeptidase